MPTPIEIQNRFKRLPQDLKEAIFSEEAANAIQATAKKNRLTTEAMGKLADEVGLFMLGFTPPEKFADILQKNIGVSFEAARSIVEDLNAQVFAPVRESLKRAHTLEENHAVPVPEAPKAAPQPVMMPKPATPAITRPMPAPAPVAAAPKPAALPPSVPAIPPLMTAPVKPALPATKPAEPSPFESKLQDKIFTIQKETTAAAREGKYPGGQDPYREPVK